MSDYTTLKALAEAATQGEWKRSKGTTNHRIYGNLEHVASAYQVKHRSRAGDLLVESIGAANADFIAAANPSKVLELIGDLERQKAILDRKLSRISSDNECLALAAERIDQLEETMPDAAVAAVAVQCIGALHEKLLAGAPHDAASTKLVQVTIAFLTSVLDGKAANPAYLAGGFANFCQAVDQSILDEMDRCQRMLAEQVKKVELAESRALVMEQYAGWYLRLREGDSPLEVVDPQVNLIPLQFDALDAAMEDIDEAETGISENTNFLTEGL